MTDFESEELEFQSFVRRVYRHLSCAGREMPFLDAISPIFRELSLTSSAFRSRFVDFFENVWDQRIFDYNIIRRASGDIFLFRAIRYCEHAQCKINRSHEY